MNVINRQVNSDNTEPIHSHVNQNGNLHLEYSGSSSSKSNFPQNDRQEKIQQNPMIINTDRIRHIQPDDGNLTELVRDRICAQAKEGVRPMFINNYYVGNNSWRPGGPEVKVNSRRNGDTLINRSSTQYK